MTWIQQELERAEQGAYNDARMRVRHGTVSVDDQTGEPANWRSRATRLAPVIAMARQIVRPDHDGCQKTLASVVHGRARLMDCTVDQLVADYGDYALAYGDRGVNYYIWISEAGCTAAQASYGGLDGVMIYTVGALPQ